MATGQRQSAARFTEAARKIVFLSRYEASSGGSPYIEPHHLLLALLRAGKPVLRLWSLDGMETVESIRAEVEAAFPRKTNRDRDWQLPLSEAGKRVFDYAIEEAEHMGFWHIGVEHLLLGLLREEFAPSAVPVLHARGLQLDATRRVIAGQGSARPEA